jgi:hypothetical protein
MSLLRQRYLFHHHFKIIFELIERPILHLQINNVRLRLFLTSRPELPIRLGFKKMSADVHKDMILHEVPLAVISHDIASF